MAMNSQRKSKAAILKRYKTRVENYKVEEQLTEELLDHMHEALECAQNNPKELHQSIESALNDLLKGEVKKDGSSHDDALLNNKETKQLVEFVSESMRNHILSL